MPESSKPFAVVTGGNRGIGRETCRQLAQRGYRVLLTSRDAERGQEAVEELGADGGELRFHTLDVTNPHSVDALAAYLSAAGGRIDALVNNAGVALDGFDADIVARTLDVNYHGVVRVIDALRPLLAPRARLVMVSSGIGELAGMPAIQRARFEEESLTRPELDRITAEFHETVAEGRHQAAGWPTSAYRVSKVALNAYARILARELADTDIHIIAVCPGWVRTDMGGHSAPRPVAEGARGVVWAATLPPDGPKKGFFRDGAQIPW